MIETLGLENKKIPRLLKNRYLRSLLRNVFNPDRLLFRLFLIPGCTPSQAPRHV